MVTSTHTCIIVAMVARYIYIYIFVSIYNVSSFKVSLMINNVQDVYKCERWPSGILIKRFFNKANHDNNVNVNSNL